MEFPCRAILAMVLLSLSPIYCSDLDQEIQAAFTRSQLALSEQSSTMDQHSQALSLHSKALARILEQNQLQSQDMSQALVQMAQSFQEAISQLTQELSRQHSSFLSHLTEGQCSQQSATFREMSENMGQLFRNSEDMKRNLSKIEQSLTETIITQMSEMIIKNLSSITQELQESRTTVIHEPSHSQNPVNREVPFGFEKVSDGWFLIVKVKRSWDIARQHCQDHGADLATPPTNIYALRRYLWDTIGEDEAWLSGRLDGLGRWTYLDGVNVNSSHWSSGEPSTNDDCVVIYGSKSPPLMGRGCGNRYFFICQYG